jgi:flagellar basal body-associated protein FliL
MNTALVILFILVIGGIIFWYFDKEKVKEEFDLLRQRVNDAESVATQDKKELSQKLHDAHVSVVNEINKIRDEVKKV